MPPAGLQLVAKALHPTKSIETLAYILLFDGDGGSGKRETP
jgi:hypothetical protein